MERAPWRKILWLRSRSPRIMKPSPREDLLAGGLLVLNRTYEDIAHRAYELFLSRGAQHGCDVDDWLEAERQVTTDSGPPRTPTRRLASNARASKAAARQRSR